jgi:perosamine synthetase
MGVQAARIVFPALDREEIAAAVSDMLSTGMLTLGPYTRQFEAAFAAAHAPEQAAAQDVPHAVAAASGTAALEIALRAVGVTGRDVVIPANTFYATAAAVLAAGGFRGHRRVHLRAEPGHPGGRADPGHGRGGARAHRRADHAARR